MKPLQVMTSLMLLVTFLVTPSFAADQQGNGTTEVQTNVPQVQLDYQNKRKAARQRRDEAMKARAAIIQAHEQEQAAEQSPKQ